MPTRICEKVASDFGLVGDLNAGYSSFHFKLRLAIPDVVVIWNKSDEKRVTSELSVK